MELVILMGLQAAGKSSFYRLRFAESHQCISKDHFRNNARPARRQSFLLHEALTAGRSVVIDNTNPTPTDRLELIAVGRMYGAFIRGFWLRSTLEESLRRNSERSGRARVPDIGVRATAKRFVPPTPSEGYDTLMVVVLNDSTFEERPWEPIDETG